MDVFPKKRGPRQNGKMIRKVENAQPPEVALWPIEHVCEISASNSLTRRAVLPMSVFWAIRVNWVVYIAQTEHLDAVSIM